MTANAWRGRRSTHGDTRDNTEGRNLNLSWHSPEPGLWLTEHQGLD
jgi:hypothetical protein